MAWIADGEFLTEVCREAGMPSRKTVHAWAKGSPGFAQALADAFRQARAARRLAERRKLAVWEARPRKRPATAGLRYTREIGEAICARLAEGESLSSIVRDPDMPAYGTVMKWLQRVPAFEEMYIDAREIQADYLFDEARDVAKAATPNGVWVARLQFDVIRWQRARLAPRIYCERVVVADELAPPPKRPTQIQIVRFIEGPNGEILVAPPRNEDEEQRWRRAYGAPYDGPR